MSLSDEVYKELKRLYDGGMTQEEVAAHCNIKQQQVQNFLSRARSTSGILLSTLEKMFPHAVINLYGDSMNASTLELERKNLELDKENLELKKKLFELEKEIEMLRRQNSSLPPAPASSSSESNKVLQKG